MVIVEWETWYALLLGWGWEYCYWVTGLRMGVLLLGYWVEDGSIVTGLLGWGWKYCYCVTGLRMGTLLLCYWVGDGSIATGLLGWESLSSKKRVYRVYKAIKNNFS